MDAKRSANSKVVLKWASVTQQLQEAFSYDSSAKYLIFGRATNFNEDVANTIKSFGIQPRRTSFRSLGRMASQNAGSVTTAETCSIMSSSSIKVI